MYFQNEYLTSVTVNIFEEFEIVILKLLEKKEKETRIF